MALVRALMVAGQGSSKFRNLVPNSKHGVETGSGNFRQGGVPDCADATEGRLQGSGNGAPRSDGAPISESRPPRRRRCRSSRGRASRRLATIDGPPAGPCGRRVAPAFVSSVASFAELLAGTIGSACPDRISTGLPARSAFGGVRSGTIARSRMRAGQRLRPQQQHRGGDVGAVGDSRARSARRCRSACARRSTKSRELVRATAHVVLVEHAFGEPAEEARHAVLQHAAARRQQGRARRDHLAERQQVVLVAAGAVQQQERRRARAGCPARSDG